MKTRTVSEVWANRVAGPIGAFLKQGVTPESISLCLVLGAAISVFPVLGTTTIICTIAAVALKLNLPAIQAVNWLFAGVQLILLVPFMRLGEELLGTSPLPLSPSELREAYLASPWHFIGRFGGAVVSATTGWAVVCIPLAFLTYLVLVYGLRHARVLELNRNG